MDTDVNTTMTNYESKRDSVKQRKVAEIMEMVLFYILSYC